jgi:predicted phosphoribosyltransferase/dienelactone hydrolase
MTKFFRDRRDAGRQLATSLAPLQLQHPVVVGLPRGGVPVAFEVALALDAPLDVIIVRKLGLPAQPELGMGAIGEDGTRVLNRRVLDVARVTDRELAAVEARERAEVERRALRFRGDRARLSLVGRTVIVVDDGLATGGTARAATHTVRALGAARVVLAVPVASPDSVRSLSEDADDVIVLHSPPDLRSIGEWYVDFAQTPDDEVVALLAAANPARHGEVSIDAAGVRLSGHLTLPEASPGVVLFAHGSGSSRHSPRNLAVARVLNEAGLGTLLFDLLTPAEASERGNVFDVGLLARRLRSATAWLGAQPGCQSLRVGYFGASTGAGAALWAAADPKADVDAVVSRGGRPDLAGARLAAVRTPTLLIVGGLDLEVLERNREAERLLNCEHRLEIVPGASHLFEEPGTLEHAGRLATEWFTKHLHETLN